MIRNESSDRDTLALGTIQQESTARGLIERQIGVQATMDVSSACKVAMNVLGKVGWSISASGNIPRQRLRKSHAAFRASDSCSRGHE